MRGNTYPVKVVKVKVPSLSLERVQYEAETAAENSTFEHEQTSDPHPQYTTDAEVVALIPAPPDFTTYYLWGA